MQVVIEELPVEFAIQAWLARSLYFIEGTAVPCLALPAAVCTF